MYMIFILVWLFAVVYVAYNQDAVILIMQCCGNINFLLFAYRVGCGWGEVGECNQSLVKMHLPPIILYFHIRLIKKNK